MTDHRLAPLRMTPDLRVRPWAGDRLAPAEQRIGEAWLAGPWSVVADGPFSGRTLGDLARELGEPLIGTQGAIHGRGGFPVLVKLIDAAEWLSVQVHPDDAQALELEGEPGIGKAEAWLVLDAAPGAELLLGRRADADPEAVRAAIGSAGLMDLLERIAIAAGDCLDVPAGMLHAIGPGTFVYEIQQPCDITYRVWDWGRTDRTIHVERSRRVTDPALRGLRQHVPTDAPDAVVAASPFFLARQVLVGPGGKSGATDGATDGATSGATSGGKSGATSGATSGGKSGATSGSTSGATDGSSPHVITVLDGSVDLVTDHGATRLAPYETVVLPAAAGGYRFDGSGSARVVVATVP